MPYPGSVSVAALRQYIRAAHADGIDTAPLLVKAGLNEKILSSDEARLSGDSFQTFIRLLCDHSRNPLLGLQTSDFVQPGSYSVLGYITMSCATLGDAIARIAPFEKLVGDMGITRIKPGVRSTRLSWQCAYTDPVVRPQLVDNVFGSWIRYARWLADNPIASPTGVTLTRPSPGVGLESAYTERWGCPVTFQAPHNALTFATKLLAEPLRQPDSQLRRTLEAHAYSQLATLDTDTTLITRVKHAIQQQLIHGISRQDIIASDLGMTTRTLQRKLSHEGAPYQSLLDDVRQAMAEDLLATTQLPIPEVAQRLGFSETASFHRKFKLCSGVTPGEFRSRAATREQSG